MVKKDKLKCYTRKANDGHIYTTCDDKSVEKPKKKKVRLVLKQPKEAATDAMNAIKEVRNISGSPKLKKQFIERLKAEIETQQPANTTAKPKPKPANYDMLRPEIRKNILQFAGARSDVDGLINEILIAKPGFPKKIRLLEKYNNMLNSKQPYLFSITLPSKQAEVEILIDEEIKLEKKQRTLRSRMPKVMERERISDGRAYSSGWDEGRYYKTNDLSDEQDPEDMAELDRLRTALVENQRQMVLANRPRSEALGEDKHIFMEDAYEIGGGRKGIMKIFRAMKDKIDRPVLIKILKKVLKSL